MGGDAPDQPDFDETQQEILPFPAVQIAARRFSCADFE